MNIDDISVKPTTSIRETLKVIGTQGLRMALVINDDKSLFGILTDSDIRRGLLDGMGLDESVKSITKKDPITAHETDSNKHILDLAIRENKYEIPIVNDFNQVVNIESVSRLLHKKSMNNRVILMVGGLGTRLRPLTNSIPKPMLKVGSKPILQIIIERFAKYGFRNFTFCTGYKSSIIEEYFGDGSRFDVDIEYVTEEKRMGTAGALSYLKDLPNEPFFVMNGDILTEIDFDAMLRKHTEHSSCATMATREFEYQIPYGVVKTENENITSIIEKPLQSFFVSAGVYVLEPEVVKYIPKDSFFDMPNLFEKLIDENLKISKYDIDGYWIDIGRKEEYDRANESFWE